MVKMAKIYKKRKGWRKPEHEVKQDANIRGSYTKIPGVEFHETNLSDRRIHMCADAIIGGFPLAELANELNVHEKYLSKRLLEVGYKYTTIGKHRDLFKVAA